MARSRRRTNGASAPPPAPPMLSGPGVALAAGRQLISIRRRIGTPGAPPTLLEGELAYNADDQTPVGHQLFIGDGVGVQTLVSQTRQVELTGAQSIVGEKTIGINLLKIIGGAVDQHIATDGAGNLSFAGPVTQASLGGPFLTDNQSISLSGAVSGTGTTAITTTLATVNSNIGTFQGLTVNAQGLITGAVDQNYLTANQPVTLTQDVTGSGATSITATVGRIQNRAVAATAPTEGQVYRWNDTATEWQPQTLPTGISEPAAAGNWLRQVNGTNTWVAGLPLTGGELSGDLRIRKANPFFFMHKAASGQQNIIRSYTGDSERWRIVPGDDGPESGANAGSNFIIQRYSDAGGHLEVALNINRATGNIAVARDIAFAINTVRVSQGRITIAALAPVVALDKTSTAQGNYIAGSTNGLNRWQFWIGDNTDETGGNAGSDLRIVRYNDAGQQIAPPALVISRATGVVEMPSGLDINNTGTGNSLRIRNGATDYLVMGANGNINFGATTTGDRLFFGGVSSGARGIFFDNTGAGTGIFVQQRTAAATGRAFEANLQGSAPAASGYYATCNSPTGYPINIWRTYTSTRAVFNVRGSGATTITPDDSDMTALTIATTTGVTDVIGIDINIAAPATGTLFRARNGATNHFAIAADGTITLSSAAQASLGLPALALSGGTLTPVSNGIG
ncbi:MAG: hypothetical protein C5B60_02390, partial [Chloroflexi bacterium]